MSEEKTTQQLAYEALSSSFQAADIIKRVANAMDEYAKAKTDGLNKTIENLAEDAATNHLKVKELQKEVEIWKEYKNTTDKKLVERLDYESERDEIILKLKAENEALKDCLRKLTKSGLKEKIEARMKAQELLNQTTTENE